MSNLKITVGQWIICISGIIVLTLIAVLPPVLRILVPKEETVEPNNPPINPSPSPDNPPITEKPLETTGALTCTKKESDTTGYTNQISRNIQYSDNKVHTIINSYTENYIVSGTTNKDARDAKKALCDSTASSYIGISGYTKTCTEDNETQFTTNEIFDLNTFQDIEVETPAGTEILSSDIKLNEIIDEVKNRLEESGYICEQ